MNLSQIFNPADGNFAALTGGHERVERMAVACFIRPPADKKVTV